MPFGYVIDIDSLVAPISDDMPQGSDVRADRSPTSDYYVIKDARNNARAAERSAMFGDVEVDLYTPWVTVSELATKILSSQSKDLEVATWYLESLVRLSGVSGLRDGMKLINQLVNDHWDGLFPMPDEDGIETRVAPLTGLNGDGGEGTLLAPLRNIEITIDGDHGAFSFWQYQQARDADRIDDEDRKAERISTLGYSLSSVNDTIAQTDIQTCRNFIETIEEALAAYKETSSKLRELCGGDAPPSSKITELLDEVLRTTRFAYKEKIQAADDADAAAAAVSEPSEVSSDETVTTSQVVHMTNAAAGPITNREDALKRLEEVAKYFRQYEPHTPLAPSLERIVSWGRMTVAELMMELIPDSTARSLYSQFTGVMLDGSDTHSYVAPPVVKPATSQTTPTSQGAADAAPAAEPAAKMGW